MFAAKRAGRNNVVVHDVDGKTREADEARRALSLVKRDR